MLTGLVGSPRDRTLNKAWARRNSIERRMIAATSAAPFQMSTALGTSSGSTFAPAQCLSQPGKTMPVSRPRSRL